MNVTSQMSFNQAKGSIVAIVEFIHTDDKTKSVFCSTYPLTSSLCNAIAEWQVPTQGASSQRLSSLISNTLNLQALSSSMLWHALKAVWQKSNVVVSKSIFSLLYLSAIASILGLFALNKHTKDTLAG